MALGSTGAIFGRLDTLLDAARSVDDLKHHRLLLVAARRHRERGLIVPDLMLAVERMAAAGTLAVPPLLAKVRAAMDGPILLVKGAEVARRYPTPALRSFGDVDLIVPDASRSQRELLRAGFQLCGEASVYEGIHHLQPLRAPGLPLLVELHHEPKWVGGMKPPSVDELLALAVPAPHLGEGILTLPPAPHVLLLAAHTWGHYPLTPLRDLLDIALIGAEADAPEVEGLAASWGLERVWRSTWQAADFVFGDGRRPLSTRIWARQLTQVRERTVLESHLQRWLAGLWAMPPRRACAHLRDAIVHDLRPNEGESVGAKVARTNRAMRNAFVRKSDYDHTLNARAEGGQ
jgi:hypothetical protein